MADENIKDQLVTVPKLANLLAKDRSFVSEIGLDEFSSREVVQKLKLVIGFVFAMYNTAKSIFKSDEYPTLDDKFIELIHSRICLMPEIIESKPRPRDYAEQCYYLHRMKMESEEPEKKWEDMALYEQFFEICVCVFLEEMKLDRSDLHLLMPEFERISSRSILACTFKGVFSYINWELDDHVESTQKDTLSSERRPALSLSGKEFRSHQRRFNRFSLAIAIVISGLIGSLTVRHLVMKYAVVQAAGGDYKKAIQLYMKSAIKAFDPNDTNAQNLKKEAWQKLERCERRLKEYEGFWVKYENDWWHVLSKGSFFTICVISGLGVTGVCFLATWFLLASITTRVESYMRFR